MMWLRAILLAVLISAAISPGRTAYLPTYDIVSFMPNAPDDAAIIRVALVKKVRMVAGLPNAKCIAKTAAAGSSTVTLNKVSGGVTTAIGTLVWAPAGTACTVTFSSTVDFAVGDIVEEVFPSPPDGTFADIAISLPATHLQ